MKNAVREVSEAMINREQITLSKIKLCITSFEHAVEQLHKQTIT